MTPRKLLCVLCVALILCLHSGCIGMLAQLGYWTGANLIPAEYDGLENERVAVICVSSNASYGVGVEAELLARSVAAILKEEVQGIELIPHDEIADWVDKNDWDEVDYREVGRGVKATRVVALDLSGFRLYEGQTLYRGRANIAVTVLDLEEGGKEVFRRQLSEVKFPAAGVYHSSETSEAAFRRAFIQVIARQVGQYFHEYDGADRYGRDPASLD